MDIYITIMESIKEAIREETRNRSAYPVSSDEWLMVDDRIKYLNRIRNSLRDKIVEVIK